MGEEGRVGRVGSGDAEEEVVRREVGGRPCEPGPKREEKRQKESQPEGGTSIQKPQIKRQRERGTERQRHKN